MGIKAYKRIMLYGLVYISAGVMPGVFMYAYMAANFAGCKDFLKSKTYFTNLKKKLT